MYTPAPAKLLSDRVTKGLCEMAPPIREAAARTADVAAAAFVAARAAEEAAENAAAAARPALAAVCRNDDEVCEDDFAGLSADLKATVDAEDFGGPADLAAGPVLLSAQRVEPYEVGDCAARPGHARRGARPALSSSRARAEGRRLRLRGPPPFVVRKRRSAPHTGRAAPAR